MSRRCTYEGVTSTSLYSHRFLDEPLECFLVRDRRAADPKQQRVREPLVLVLESRLERRETHCNAVHLCTSRNRCEWEVCMGGAPPPTPTPST